MTRTSEAQILDEHRQHEARVVAEHTPFNVALTVCSGPEVKMIIGVANDMEAGGDEPRVVFMRGDDKRIIGLTLVGHVAAHLETLEQRIGAR